MIKPLMNWLDRRTGCRAIVHDALYENVPGGARWRYVWGSTLTFALAIQFITGIFLWMGYSPSSQTAWESVYYIQDVMKGGWLLRGLSGGRMWCWSSAYGCLIRLRSVFMMGCWMMIFV